MIIHNDWKSRLLPELQRAKEARASGNEGRARVCARRVAGIIAQEFINRTGSALSTSNMYDILRQLIASPDISPQAREIVAHFFMRVDIEFSLPDHIDLLDDSRWLANELLGESI